MAKNEMQKMTLRPMEAVEHHYCFAQSQQISMQTGLIGHLRADFGSEGEGFFSTFFDFRASLKSDEFRAEFDEVINTLREGAQFGGILKDREAMRTYCKAHPESCIEAEGQYGFRMDTDNYSYMLRVNPHKGEYNLYCYCYVRERLDRHISQAEKGIRFITSDYKEKFRIADGDKIRIVTKAGEQINMVCRYIDDYHLETGSYPGDHLYHICEFAERMEQSECQTIIPLRSSLPDMAYVFVEAHNCVGIVHKGESGYIPTAIYGATPAETRAVIDKMNNAINVSKGQAEAMKCGSLFGWGVPGADPKNYDAEGKAIRNKKCS